MQGFLFPSLIPELNSMCGELLTWLSEVRSSQVNSRRLFTQLMGDKILKFKKIFSRVNFFDFIFAGALI
jgi:hypothetical protein